MKNPIILCFLTALCLFSNCKTPKNTPYTEGSPKGGNSKIPISPPVPVRGVWLTSVVSDAFASKENLQNAVKKCSDNGINTIFVVVWNRGRTLYPSKTLKDLIGIDSDEKLKERDILKETIDAAKPLGIRVFAWFEFGFSCDYSDKNEYDGKTQGKEILQKKPQWAAMDRDGKIVKKNGFRWLNGFDPEVQNFMLSMLKEVVRDYPDLAGIQGDDRLPALPSEAGYDPKTISMFSNENDGKMPPNDPKETVWLDWKAGKMNDFMKRIHDELKAIKPTTVISMSPSIYNWSKIEYLQDWPLWVKNGWVDMVCPQVYRYQFERYQKEIALIKQQVGEEKLRTVVFPGILLRVGDYYAPVDFLEKMIAENRKYGINGEVFFYYEGMKKYPEFFKNLYKKKVK
jgi:uncharacterized lipoprotein YddW (UPF0748 family)